MQPDQDPHTLCNKCSNYVRTQNYLIHEARCKGPSSTGQSRASSRIFSSSRNPNPSPNRQPAHNSQSTQQRIPCVFCGYGQTLKQLDTHPGQCQHREQECRHCGNRFPKSLMGQHLQFCPARQRGNPRQQPIFMNQEQDQFGYEPSQTLFDEHRQQIQRRHSHRNDSFSMMNVIMGQMMGMGQRRAPSNQRTIHFADLGALIHYLAAAQGQGHQQHGLSKQDIKKFNVAKYKAGKKGQQEEDLCVVCYCKFEQGEDCMTLPCKHVFHPECVSTWLEKNPTCPVCKHNFGPPQQEEQPVRNNQRTFFRVFQRM